MIMRLIMVSFFMVPTLGALSEQELIQMIENGKKQVSDSNRQMVELKESLLQTIDSLDKTLKNIESYIQLKDTNKNVVSTVKTQINFYQNQLNSELKKVPTVSEVASLALRPVINEKNRVLGDIDAMFAAIGDLLSVAQTGITQIKHGMVDSSKKLIPKILSKGGETLDKLERLKKRAPAIAAYVSEIEQQVSGSK